MTVTEYILNYDTGIPTIWMVGTNLVVGCAVVALFMYGGSKAEIIKNCSWVLLAGYVFLVFCSTIICRDGYPKVNYNIHPFLYIHSKNVIIIGERILNIILFVPIGLLSSVILNKWRPLKVFVLGGCLSASIELLQLELKKGVCNIDDVINNVAGCIIGYCLFLIIKLCGYYRIK